MVYNFNNNGCSGADTLQLQVSECVGLKNIGSVSRDWRIFPNPTNDFIQIITPNSSAVKLEVSDALGRIVLVTENLKPSEKISVRDLAKGVYLVQLTSDKDQQTKIVKLIKE